MTASATKPVKQWNEGDTVWYDPDGLGILFRGFIRGTPREIGGQWLVQVDGLPPEYSHYSGRRYPMTTASLNNVYPRRKEDERASITWLEAQLGKMDGVAATQEDTGS